MWKATAFALLAPPGHQVVGVSLAVKSLHRPGDRAVVEKPEVVVAVLGEQRVGLGDLDPAAKQMREHAVVVPGAVPLEPALEALEEEVRDPSGEHLVGRRPVFVRQPVAGHKRALPVDEYAASGLVDV